jgi:hypothetical protein
MRHKKLTWYAVLFLVLSMASLEAQNILVINEKSGTQATFNLSGIKTLTFSTNNLTINKKDGTLSAYVLTDLRYLNFGTATALGNYTFDSKLMLFPNPVTNQLCIQYSSSTIKKVQLQILDIQGRIVLQQTLDSFQGTNYAFIPVTQFSKGLYFVLIQNGNKLETTKFIKN